MTKQEYYFLLREKYEDDSVFSEIESTCERIEQHFGSHERIMVPVSGGADSDCIVHLVCTYFPEYLSKCNFVFVDTGLEYAATKRHLDEIEKKYGITIDRVKGMSVVTAVRKFGIPILNKAKSKSLSLFLRRTPRGEYLVFEASGSQYGFTEAERNLARYLDENHISVSNKCCDVSKKKPLHEYEKLHNIDLDVSGERKAEGGRERLLTNLVSRFAKTVRIDLCRCFGGQTR